MTLVGSDDGNYGVGGQQKTPTVDMVRVGGLLWINLSQSSRW